ncbi:MATE family efflux transporter [Aquirhabdus sp.]|uniref:MATE family efflux transporter n=1 Tax=Aquirhabdus sp. TaxID=2824160 RepID=UPI00396C7EFB
MTSLTSAAPSAPKPLWRTYLVILIPMMLTNVLQASAGTIDSIYLGQMIGVNALAAVSTFFPIFFFLFAIIIGLGSGTTVLIGQAWGAKDLEKVRAVAGTALCLMLSLGFAISMVGSAFAPNLMQLLGTPANILVDATRYAHLMLLGMPVIFLLWLMTSMSRGVGDAVTPLWALVLTTLISLVLTPAFIRGWWGLPHLGVISAAASTLIASVIGIAWMMWHWHRKGHPLAFNEALLNCVRVDGVIARKILSIGLPSCFQMLTMAVAEVVLLGLVNRHGSEATAAYGAVNQVMSWIQLPAMSLGISASILASHAIGAGNGHRLGAIVRTGLGLNVVITGFFVALVYLLAPTIIGLFITDVAVIQMALTLLHIVAWSVIVLGLATVLTGTMRASGTVLPPTALGVFAILCIELPVAYVLNARIGIEGIWYAYALTFVAIFSLNALYYRLVWRHKQIARLI